MECSGFWYLWTAHRRLFLVSQRHGLSCGRLGIVGVDCLQFIHVGDEDNGIRQNLLFPQQRQVYRRQQFAGTDAVADLVLGAEALSLQLHGIDADVLAHALADAILGACRGGDIGKLFPDTDPAYEGADSMVLLARVMGYARELGFEFVDADCTIACQQPKITPHRDAMRANLAHALGVDVENVGVAATTTEKLGWEGQGEGIGAWAVCLLQKTVKE